MGARNTLLELMCVECFSVSLSLEHVPEDDSPGTFRLKCFACCKPVTVIPMHSIDHWLRRQDDLAPSEKMTAGESAKYGYLPAGYLKSIGFEDEDLQRAVHGTAWPFRLDFSHSPPLVMEPPR